MLSLNININLTGYTYQLNEESTVLTIKEGFLKKEIHNLQVDDDNYPAETLRIMMAINKANDMWAVTIIIIAFFYCGIYLAVLFTYEAERKRKEVCTYLSFMPCHFCCLECSNS